MTKYYLIFLYASICLHSIAQNVGIGTTTPIGKLHIKGNADASQLVIDAHTIQSNTRPLLKFRNANGVDILGLHTDSEYNLFVGVNAGRVNAVNIPNNEGLYNTFVGSGSGYYNITGNNNTALGRNSLFQNTVGNDNTSIGFKSLFSNTDGYNNTAVGSESLLSNIGGIDNTAMGARALSSNTEGSRNTAVGTFSLALNSTATSNVAVGAAALQSQSYNPGIFWYSDNTAVGAYALALNQPTNISNGIKNTAIGASALNTNSTGFHNTALGAYALWNNTTASENTAVGTNALKNNKSGWSNTAIGYSSLAASVDAYRNTALGTSALANNNNGNYNIAIGFRSGTHAAAPNVINTISIGNDGILNAYPNQAFIGNVSTAWIGGQVNWSTYSDERVKRNITEDVKGLDFITRLRPVTYNKNFAAITTITGNAETENFPGKYDGEIIKYSGFLAQDVEAAAQQSNYNFSGLHKPKGKFDLYSLSYAEFVVPLVKAVQELNGKLELLQKDNDELKARLAKFEMQLLK